MFADQKTTGVSGEPRPGKRKSPTDLMPSAMNDKRNSSRSIAFLPRGGSNAAGSRKMSMSSEKMEVDLK
jgi:hypothetical protein